MLLVIFQTDISSASDVMKCEIRSSCFPSSGCQDTKPMTVDPDSNIILNCSIVTGGLAQGMTWAQAKQRVENSTGSLDLVLQQYNSTKNNETCLCYITSALQVIDFSSSPRYIYEDTPPAKLKRNSNVFSRDGLSLT
ncbi:hypothetical protein OS493_006678 [Desmophyllum pertusum]|uniref:Uncharacterized protein n=1 Tax=Desmophyllum pertusum TaxID=174260 RepID=A0A9W9ZS24_9CNID|nr:hypothetical protein OS493_006678 [Desmophyllum pertusum]